MSWVVGGGGGWWTGQTHFMVGPSQGPTKSEEIEILAFLSKIQEFSTEMKKCQKKSTGAAVLCSMLREALVFHIVPKV